MIIHVSDRDYAIWANALLPGPKPGCLLRNGNPGGSRSPWAGLPKRRFAYALSNGPLRHGSLVETTCGTLKCLNPEHLVAFLDLPIHQGSGRPMCVFRNYPACFPREK